MDFNLFISEIFCKYLKSLFHESLNISTKNQKSAVQKKRKISRNNGEYEYKGKVKKNSELK
jgi:hypothetical protein